MEDFELYNGPEDDLAEYDREQAFEDAQADMEEAQAVEEYGLEDDEY